MLNRYPRSTISAVMMGGGALVVFAALLLPWVTYSYSLLGVTSSASASGFNLGVGIPFDLLLVLALAIFIGMKGYATTWMSVAGIFIALCGLALAFVPLMTWSPSQMSVNGTPVASLMGSTITWGIGLWIAVVGFGVILIGAVLTFQARPSAGGFAMLGIQQTIVSAPPRTVVASPLAAAPPAQRTNYAPGTQVSSQGIEKTRPMGGQSAPAAWLVVQGGSHHGQQFALKRGDTNIGRNGQQSDVVIDHASVSGQHARVRYDHGKFWLYDLASTNGTYINNGRVSKQLLCDTDRVRLGDVTLVFKIVERRH